MIPNYEDFIEHIQNVFHRICTYNIAIREHRTSQQYLLDQKQFLQSHFVCCLPFSFYRVPQSYDHSVSFNRSALGNAVYVYEFVCVRFLTSKLMLPQCSCEKSWLSGLVSWVRYVVSDIHVFKIQVQR
jgi:hypothetical protein